MFIIREEYIEFIKWFTDSVNIMSKKFYVVIPYAGSAFTGGKKSSSGLLDAFLGSKKKDNFREESAKFEEQRSQLEQRIAIIKSGLGQFGVRSEQLNTEQTIEVFYNMFNPSEAHRNIPKIQ